MFRVHEYIKCIQVLSLESGLGSGSAVQTAQVGGSPAASKRHLLGSSRLVRGGARGVALSPGPGLLPGVKTLGQSCRGHQCEP